MSRAVERNPPAPASEARSQEWASRPKKPWPCVSRRVERGVLQAERAGDARVQQLGVTRASRVRERVAEQAVAVVGVAALDARSALGPGLGDRLAHPGVVEARVRVLALAV